MGRRLFSLGLTFLLPWCGLLLLFRLARPARALGVIVVNPGESIQAAIDTAAPGDTILINPGTYTESLTLGKAVSLTGVSSSTTIVHAEPDRRVLTVTGTAIDSQVVISGLTFTGGDLTQNPVPVCPRDCGGGILLADEARPLLTNLTIRENTAAGGGGGLYATGITSSHKLQIAGSFIYSNVANDRAGGGIRASGAVIISHSRIQQNRCQPYRCDAGGVAAGELTIESSIFLSNTADGEGGAAEAGPMTVTNSLFRGNEAVVGGGLSALRLLLITNSQFISNGVSYAGGGVIAREARIYNTVFQNNYSPYFGGGLSIGDGALVMNSVFEGNRGDLAGGLFVTGTLEMSGTSFLSNTAETYAGGAYATGSVVATGTLFYGNGCSAAGACLVGGLFAAGDLRLERGTFVKNGGYIGGAASNIQAVAKDSQFEANNGTWQGAIRANALTLIESVFIANDGDVGGAAEADVMTITSSLFQDNTGSVGGAVAAEDKLHMTSSTFISNSAQLLGGAAAVGNELVATDSFFAGNSSDIGGGLYVESDTLKLDRTKFFNNVAFSDGGAVFISVYEQEFQGTITNSLFIDNSASGDGAALYSASPGTIILLHNTIAGSGPNPRQAIYVKGQATISNTIVASHAIGIENAGGIVSEDYSLFFGNTTNLSGTIPTGANSLYDVDPLFVNPPVGDYHLDSESPAVDSAFDLGVMTDLDGNPRPIGFGPDRGAYETGRSAIDLSLSKAVFPTEQVLPGQPLTYTLAFSNQGIITATGVILTDLVPITLTQVTVFSSGVPITRAGSLAYVWQVANLPPEGFGLVTITGRISPTISQESWLVNRATVTATESEYNPSDNSDLAALPLVPPEIRFGAAVYTVSEVGGAAQISVELVLTNHYALAAVDYLAVGGTAAPGIDYGASSGTVIVLSGTMVTAFTVPITDDNTAEGLETVILQLTAPRGAALGTPFTTTLNIVDDDMAGLTLTPTTLNLMEGGVSGFYSITLSSQPTASVIISVQPESGIVAQPRQLTFSPANWTVSQNVVVWVPDDLIVEAPYNSVVSHTVVSADPLYDGWPLGGISITIFDNDPALYLPVVFKPQVAVTAAPPTWLALALKVRGLLMFLTLVVVSLFVPGQPRRRYNCYPKNEDSIGR